MSRGHGRIFLRGQTYWMAYYLHGKEYRESTHSTDQKEAEKFLQTRMQEVGADAIGAKAFVTPQARRIKVQRRSPGNGKANCPSSRLA